VREKVIEETRILKTWTIKEIKQTREIFSVPDIIGNFSFEEAPSENSSPVVFENYA